MYTRMLKIKQQRQNMPNKNVYKYLTFLISYIRFLQFLRRTVYVKYKHDKEMFLLPFP